MKKKKASKKPRLERILFIPDMHVPYHDKRATELMLKAAKEFKPDHVLILGDMADFYAVSSHSKDPSRMVKFDEEVKETRNMLSRIKKLGAKNNVFIEGNHEDRLRRYLQDKAPELHSVISVPALLELDKAGYKFVPYKTSYSLGKLNVTHDLGTAGRYAHYKSLDSFQHNIIIGHTHRLGYAVEGNAVGERHVTAMFGWLGDNNEVDYMHRNKMNKDWCLGFGVGYLDVASGTIYLSPVPIVNYTVVLEGKLYNG